MDLQIRQQALNPHHSFIVEAPAGSGKTEILVQRFLSLLATSVSNPEEILAITFTRKAAHEMRTRIISALEKALDNNTAHMQSTTVELAKKVLTRDSAENWQLLANPNRLRIQTIDALCMSLTQQMPIISGLGGQAKMANYPNDLYRKAVQAVLATLDEPTSWHDDLIAIFKHFDNQY
ncbi:MAG: UvrD-helicase domain-containing protein, partial [Gammaproteobacteria bacterium]